VVEVAGLARTEGAVAGLADEVWRIAEELRRQAGGSESGTSDAPSGPRLDAEPHPVPGAEPAVRPLEGADGDQESR
jgi:hypothetical protein